MTKNIKQLELFSEEVIAEPQEFKDGFDPFRLTQARELAGLSKQALGSKVGITGAAIGQYEARVTTPSQGTILELARVLDYPPAFFLAGRPHGQVDTSQAHFRSLRSTRLYERQKATAFVEAVWELVFILDQYVEFPHPSVPSVEESSDNMTPTEAATALREYWDLGNGPVSHLTRIMEYFGLIVVSLPFTDSDEQAARIDAFSTYALDRPFVITTAERSTSVYRHRFTCAHELGHLILHRDIVTGDSSQEREADAFAAELLTPKAEMVKVLPQTINLNRLGEIGEEWGVSIESLIRRMQEIRGASDVSVRRAYQKIREQRSLGLRLDPETRDHIGEIPTLLKDAVKIADQQGHSLVDIANKLRWPVQKLRKIIGIRNPRPKLHLVPDLPDKHEPA